MRVLRQLYQVADGDGRRGQVGRRQGAAGGEASRGGSREARGLLQRRSQRGDRRLLLLGVRWACFEKGGEGGKGGRRRREEERERERAWKSAITCPFRFPPRGRPNQLCSRMLSRAVCAEGCQLDLLCMQRAREATKSLLPEGPAPPPAAVAAARRRRIPFSLSLAGGGLRNTDDAVVVAAAAAPTLLQLATP